MVELANSWYIAKCKPNSIHGFSAECKVCEVLRKCPFAVRKRKKQRQITLLTCTPATCCSLVQDQHRPGRCFPAWHAAWTARSRMEFPEERGEPWSNKKVKLQLD